MEATQAGYTISQPVASNPRRAWTKCNITGVGTLVGYSRAADRTFFNIPELNLGLDAGEVRGRQPKYVFITHTHIDHAKDVPYVTQKEGTTIYCPSDAQRRLKNYVKTEICFNLNMDFDRDATQDGYLDKHWTLVPCQPGDEGDFGKGDVYHWTAFKCEHSVPCLGYYFDQNTSKLKPEYEGLPGKELGLLRKQKVEITEKKLRPLFVYVGDTAIQVFDKNPRLFDYSNIIVECTFLIADEGIPERCDRDGHILWSQLEPHVLAHPDIMFILIHFSLRYKNPEIVQFFDDVERRIGRKLNNVVLFLSDYSYGSFD